MPKLLERQRSGLPGGVVIDPKCNAQLHYFGGHTNKTAPLVHQETQISHLAHNPCRSFTETI
jgi:hypothetical protein